MPASKWNTSSAKRILDVGVVVLTLPVTLPLLVVTAAMIALWLGRPVLFQQRRTGRNGQIFTLFKFRTMTSATDPSGDLLPDEQRLTRFGQFLRSTSLDELPELWNILNGEMSLVGPRPLLPEYLGLYSLRQRRRHEAIPGLTGWAQVNGRNSCDWESRLEMDVWYADHSSFWLDLKILCLTLLRVLQRDGVQAQGHATMPAFSGTSGEGEMRQQLRADLERDGDKVQRAA